VIALIISIISVAVPYWGYYGPAGASYLASGIGKNFILENLLFSGSLNRDLN